MLIGDDSIIYFANQGAHTMFGYQQEELIHQRIDALIQPFFREEHKELIKKYFTDPLILNMGHHRKVTGVKKDGSEIPLEIGLDPIAPEWWDWSEGGGVIAVTNDLNRSLFEPAKKTPLPPLGPNDSGLPDNL